MVLCMSSMILGGCIPSPKKQTEAITVEENPNMMLYVGRQLCNSGGRRYQGL